jgi:hypothetical protein
LDLVQCDSCKKFHNLFLDEEHGQFEILKKYNFVCPATNARMTVNVMKAVEPVSRKQTDWIECTPSEP